MLTLRSLQVLYYLLTISYWLQVILGGSGLHTVSAGGPVDTAKQVKFQQVKSPKRLWHIYLIELPHKPPADKS